MFERQVVVRVREGLHARPATRFVKLAKSFASDIELVSKGKSGSAKSSVKVMLLAVKENDEVTLRISGDDEEKAVTSLVAYLENPEAGLTDDEGSVAPMDAAPVQKAKESTSGLGASEGIAIGPVFRFFPEVVLADPRPRHGAEINVELKSLGSAFEGVTRQMNKSLDQPGLDVTNRSIIKALLELVNDESMRAEMTEMVGQGSPAVSAILTIIGQNADAFAKMDDLYLRARADDFLAIGRQLALAAMGKEDVDLAAVPDGAIMIADDLGAFELAKAPVAKIGGLICAKGSRTSHIAIIARSNSIPAVLGIGDAIAALRHAKVVVLDGKTGEIVADPSPDVLKVFESRRSAAQQELNALKAYKDMVPKLANGTVIEVAANIGSLQEVDAAQAAGAMGVGLFRTELLFMQTNRLPDEDEQTDVYAKVAVAFSPYPVIIRTLDIGGDKPVAGIEFPHEENPFLGWRGIRMCLDRPDIFKPQLRALLRAAVHGAIKVMIPMVVDVTEVRRTKAMIDECVAELESEKKPYKRFDLGIMVETPAAVLNAPELSREVAFFSIGTNDLAQYVMAADRLNPRVAALNDVSHPAVMAAIRLVAKAGREAGIMVGMCGEAAAREELIPAFIEMGLTEFSMSPASVLKAKRAIFKLAGATA
jgi:phosphoenolpyruvate-protein phosphotransferase (PTS system enzyme I)